MTVRRFRRRARAIPLLLSPARTKRTSSRISILATLLFAIGPAPFWSRVGRLAGASRHRRPVHFGCKPAVRFRREPGVHYGPLTDSGYGATVHPHMRGDILDRLPDMHTAFGSPPHAWGHFRL